jgi:hypothetical protein
VLIAPDGICLAIWYYSQRNYLDEEVIHILLAVFRHAVEFSKNTRSPDSISVSGEFHSGLVLLKLIWCSSPVSNRPLGGFLSPACAPLVPVLISGPFRAGRENITQARFDLQIGGSW